ncbi:MAG: 30S ribosomal protein S4 [Lentisphaerae bacterium]|jgi:small subunit ribosomal protein S4|nr:30S ribosomal protein S4 [Lentisphaerota bacterium]
MGRYTGPSCRQCRRAGTKLFLKGARCYMSKCPVDQGHPAPGMHGMRRSRKISEYGRQLREKQKLRQQFGMQEGQFRRFYERALRARGVTGENLLQMLELRLDNVVYRMGFAVSRRAARQFVLHKHVTLNGRTANVPSIVLKPGDVVVVRERPRSRDQATHAFEAATGRQMPAWLSVDPKTFRGEVLAVPTREEIAPVVEEQAIVELYSR